jgi:outer membrane immunogenic protein
MKKLLVAGIAAAALLSAPALAGPPPSVFNWSGFYVGVNGGGMNFSTSGSFHFVANEFVTGRKEIGLGGIHGGFQAQWGNLVVGIEGAWDATLGNGFSKSLGTNTPSICPASPPIVCQARINDILTVGPRVGFAMGQWIVYGTGGYARAEIESGLTPPVTANGNNHHNGWYAGGGLEFFVMNGFVVGVEYKHYDFSSAYHNDVFAAVLSRDLSAKADAVLLRLTIKQ